MTVTNLGTGGAEHVKRLRLGLPEPDGGDVGAALGLPARRGAERRVTREPAQAQAAAVPTEPKRVKTYDAATARVTAAGVYAAGDVLTGTATVLDTETLVNVDIAADYGAAFEVGSAQATPSDGPAQQLFGIQNEDGESFDIVMAAAASGDAVFNWLVKVGTLAPQNLAVVSTGDGTVTLSWDAVAGATAYRISYGTASGVYTQAVTVAVGDLADAANPEHELSGLTNGTLYYFAVQANTP